MAFPCLSFVILAALTLLSAADRHKRTLFTEPTSSRAGNAPPTTYFEVTRPIPLPNTKPCSYSVLHHDFASTYRKPPVLASYKPPSDCQSQNFAKIVLEWTASCKGKQFDRIFGVWLGGVEILRSCTAEPKRTGIVWTVKKDITRYYSLLMSDQTMAVYMGNIIDSTYTGVYNVNVTLHFYPAEDNRVSSSGGLRGGVGSNAADLILPVSRNLPLNDGLWFEIENSTDIESKEFRIPQNVYRAVLEVYVSFHEKDESWYGNAPNDYVSVNNLTDLPANGPFREVVVSLDDLVVGAVWPFTVIYTGGINPFLWRPITGIGSFDLPSYDIEITPLLGKILDGKSHRFAFGVTYALSVWYVDANLHLWLDKKTDQTQGKLLEHNVSPLSLSLESKFTGSDGTFVTNVSRSIVSRGWVKSSHGVITTKSTQGFRYSNSMVMGDKANLQMVNQTINLKGGVVAKKASRTIRSNKLLRKFRLLMDYDQVERGNATYASTNVTLEVDEKSYQKASGSGSYRHRIKNLQDARGHMLVKDKSVVGLGSTKQSYHYSGDKCSYSRNVRSSNYTILHDQERNTCKGTSGL